MNATSEAMASESPAGRLKIGLEIQLRSLDVERSRDGRQQRLRIRTTDGWD